MFKSLPTAISGLRLLAGPLILALYLLSYGPKVLTVIFIVASLSDALDGMLARRWQCCTKVGAWLDHLADKVLVTSTLFVLCLYWPQRILVVLTWLIVQRELIALSARSYPVALKVEAGETFAVSILGKMKTALQCISIILLLLSWDYDCCTMLGYGLVLLALSAALGWISLGYYFVGLFIGKS